MKKLVLILLSVFLLMGSFAGCSTDSDNGDSGDNGSQEKIVIGNLQDLSGATSVWGEAVKNGAELYADLVNANGGINGREVEIITYDIKLDPQEALNAYNRLVDQDKAVAVIGPPLSNVGLSLAPVAAAKGVPVVGSFIDPRVTLNEDGTPQSQMFLMQPSSVQYAEIVSDYALNEVGVKNMAVLYDQSNSFAVSQVVPFMEYFEANGGTIVAEEVYKAGDKDFKVQLNKIKEAGAEALYVPNYVQDLIITIQQAEQVGLDVAMFGGLDFAPPFVTLLSDPSQGDNIYFANNYSDEEPQLVEVREAFVEKFGEEPINKAYLGYDKMMIIVEALKNAEEITGPAVTAALENIDNLQGTTGVITISPETHQPLGLSMVMYKIENGEYLDLGRHVPESHK
ncbi:ABC transporter substrate-binding protein [Alkalibacter rhizosphaerae]|uniref:ABC transporter substrate-binding protein n=1 Tax=Alkalibacter rhizosphaerae TaxID=2815577 RepID=A0A975AIL6_9FIRM|nr:ABC transporter substrate-binding protein [Alkalibacter rhizosphaerae]QSX09218.1 ABC transporter substrate-binding protein [Alkalibacter rhizosphaerae]